MQKFLACGVKCWWKSFLTLKNLIWQKNDLIENPIMNAVEKEQDLFQANFR